MHALNGLGVGLAGVPPVWAFGGAAVYEAVEFYYERHGSVLFGTKAPESFANVATDTLLYAALYFGGRQFKDAPRAGLSAFGALTAAAFATWLITPLRERTL